MKIRTTLADVAREAGVSKTTASMVVNGKGQKNIPGPTRARVLSAANKLHFRPHGVARALSRRRADVLGVVCSVAPFRDLAEHPFEQTLLAAVFHHALERGYNPLIYGQPSETATREELSRYSDGRSDAFILLYPQLDSPLLGYLHSQDIPTVTLCTRDNSPAGRWTDCDSDTGIRAAIEHLAELGHRRIAYLIGPPEQDCVQFRICAFKSSMESLGLSARVEWIIPYRWSAEKTGAQMDALLAAPERPTALLLWYDFAVEHVYQAARERGLRIPEDLSVVGFDDSLPARVASPALTTIRQDPNQMGKAAVDLAIAALLPHQNEQSSRSTLCSVELILRQSTSPPGGA
ncbi:MAG TPA: LacI family DNA-binding transcriptional regulator [Chthonomonadales bacterium]|nr:LacI family DNA-binding transcriptional regulator [Chthonomonadales bacterium]